jgi:LPS sulfotransferase NodH
MPLTHLINTYKSNPKDIIKNIVIRLTRYQSNQKHIFVIGAPRSGTTLLKTLLCANPNIVGAAYETTGIFNFKNLMKRDSFFINEGLNKETVHKILNDSDNIIEIFDSIAQQYIQNTQSNIFCEKINSTSFNRIQYIAHHFPQSKILHLVRDGRDCYCSARNHPHVYQGKNLKKYAHYWKNAIESRMKIKNDSIFFDVKYEELTNHPEATLNQIMDFVGVPYFPYQLDPNVYGRTKLGRAQPHQNLAKKITGSSNQRFIKELTNEDIKIFQKIAGYQLKYWKYEILN